MEEIVVVVVHISCFLSGKRCSWPPSLLAAGYSLSFLISNVGLAWRVVDRHGKAIMNIVKQGNSAEMEALIIGVW